MPARNWLRNLFGRSPARTIRNGPKPPRLGLTHLEDRTVPSTVIESEGTITPTNNNFNQAQLIPAGSFTAAGANVSVNYPTATILGNGGGRDSDTGAVGDVDFYRIQANAGQLVLDIDNNPFTFDTVVSLFDASGNLLTNNDDSPVDAGSVSSLDSFLTYTISNGGTYYVSVSQFPNRNAATGNTGAASNLPYRLEVSLQNGAGVILHAAKNEVLSKV